MWGESMEVTINLQKKRASEIDLRSPDATKLELMRVLGLSPEAFWSSAKHQRSGSDDVLAKRPRGVLGERQPPDRSAYIQWGL